MPSLPCVGQPVRKPIAMRDLVRLELPQQIGEQLDLLEPTACRRNVRGCPNEVVEAHETYREGPITHAQTRPFVAAGDTSQC